MAHYEVEVKSLLGPKVNADALKQKLCTLDPAAACVAESRQLNHYFHDGDIRALADAAHPLFGGEAQQKLAQVIERGDHFSVRTRQKDDEVLLVIKASVDEGTSENTVSRLEFEEPVDLSLEELDALVQSAGFSYQAKWSREREEYHYKDMTVCIDKNAGYGFLAEFEKLTDDESHITAIKKDILAAMAELGVEELPQDRLARMFEHYNENWPTYYGTDKTFIIE